MWTKKDHNDVKNKTSLKNVNKEKQHDDVTAKNSHKDDEKDKLHKYVKKKSRIKYVIRKNSLKGNMEKDLRSDVW